MSDRSTWENYSDADSEFFEAQSDMDSSIACQHSSAVPAPSDAHEPESLQVEATETIAATPMTPIAAQEPSEAQSASALTPHISRRGSAHTLATHPGKFVIPDDSPTCSVLVFGAGAGTPGYRALQRVRCVNRSKLHTGAVYTASQALDGAYFATGGPDTIVRLWAVCNGPEFIRPQRQLTGSTGAITAITWSNSGFFATAGQDSVIRLWYHDRDAAFYSSSKLPEKAVVLAFDPADDGVLLIALINGSVRRIRVTDGAELAATDAEAHPTAMAVSQRERLVAVGTRAGYVLICDLDTLETRVRYAVCSNRGRRSKPSVITGLQFVGENLLVTSADSRIRLYNSQGEQIVKLCNAKFHNDHAEARGCLLAARAVTFPIGPQTGGETYNPQSPLITHVLAPAEDGLVFVWRLPLAVTTAIHQRQPPPIIHEHVTQCECFRATRGDLAVTQVWLLHSVSTMQYQVVVATDEEGTLRVFIIYDGKTSLVDSRLEFAFCDTSLA